MRKWQGPSPPEGSRDHHWACQPADSTRSIEDAAPHSSARFPQGEARDCHPPRGHFQIRLSQLLWVIQRGKDLEDRQKDTHP